MALIQQTMSEKNLAAHQRNARQSHGAVTPEGKERARAANHYDMEGHGDKAEQDLRDAEHELDAAVRWAQRR